jgi:methionyl-tRNA formyltransferase
MVRLNLLGYKGLAALRSLSSRELALISEVVAARDKAIQHDYHDEIIEYCRENNINCYTRQDAPPFNGPFEVAIGWRWLIPGKHTVIVFHDSLLPRLRGFNPLVTALINGDHEIGVTCLLAQDEYDKGDIIGQQSIQINYPIKISQAIELVSPLYASLLKDLLNGIEKGNFTAIPQDEKKATYSLWRDDDDYMISWNKSAADIRRFIDAVGYPYLGAATTWKNQLLRIKSAEEIPDVKIENREPGKVIFKDHESIIVVCGEGLLRVQQIETGTGENFDLTDKFRIRFGK